MNNSTKSKFSDRDLLDLIKRSIFLEKDLKEKYEGMLLKGLFDAKQKSTLFQILKNEKEGLKKIFEAPQYEDLRKQVLPITREQVWEECKKILIEQVNIDNLNEAEVRYLIGELKNILKNTNNEDIREAIGDISDRYFYLKGLRGIFEKKEQKIFEEITQNFIGIVMEEKGMDSFDEINNEIKEKDAKEYIPILMNNYPAIFNKACDGKK